MVNLPPPVLSPSTLTRGWAPRCGEITKTTLILFCIFGLLRRQPWAKQSFTAPSCFVCFSFSVPPGPTKSLRNDYINHRRCLVFNDLTELSLSAPDTCPSRRATWQLLGLPRQQIWAHFRLLL